MKTSLRGGLSVILVLVAVGSRAHADQAAEMDRLKSDVRRMEATIEELKEQIKEMQQQKSSPRSAAVVVPAPPDESAAAAPAAAPSPAAQAVDSTWAGLADQGSPMRHRDTIIGDNVAAPRPGNAAMDPSYEGFIPLLGTTTWIKLGGYAKVDAIVDSTKLGNPNKFVTATIPVSGEANHGKAEEFTIHAKQTRLSFELRSPVRLGSLRVVYENDFFGNSSSPHMDYNLRHFYGQVANLTVGQTWTTFFDPDSRPDTLDVAGPGVLSSLRQPQLRYSFSPIREEMHVAVAIEQPSADLGNLPSGGSVRSPMPDFTGQWRWEGSAGHLQVGGLFRALAWESSTGPDDTAYGWGVNLSGVRHTWGEDSIVANFTYGDGIGRYLQDLSGGNGGVVDADGKIKTLAAWGGMIGYRHFWAEDWRSEVTYGYVDLESRAEEGPKAYDHTHYSQANLVWSPVKRFYVGLEYLLGVKEARDGTRGCAHRGQMSLQYRVF